MKDQTEEIKKYLEANSVKGWLSPNEGKLLYLLAQKCPADKAIVEIGSWEGRSTIYLSNGSLTGNKARVFAVDPHNGPEQEAKDIWTYDNFIKNVNGAGAGFLVTPIVKTSAEAAGEFQGPVGLVFIDGDHSYEAVKIDFQKWFPKLADGGFIAFHDCIKFDGPKRLLAEIVPNCHFFRNAGMVDSIFFTTKTRNNSLWDRIRSRLILQLRRVFEYGAHLHHKINFPKILTVIYKKTMSLLQARRI